MKTRNEYLRNISQFIEGCIGEVGQPLIGSVLVCNDYPYRVEAVIGNMVYLVCIKDYVSEFITLTYKDLERFGFELTAPEYTIWDLIQVLSKEIIIEVRGSEEIFADGARLIQIDYKKPQLSNLSDDDLKAVEMLIVTINKLKQ